MSIELEEDIRANLYIEDESYDEFWETHKERIIKVLTRHEDLIERTDTAYCFESDEDRERDYLDECGYGFRILVNENGIIIYQKIKLNDFFINGIKVESWNYNEYDEELEFYAWNKTTGHTELVATISETNDEYDKLITEFDDYSIWNKLVELFGDELEENY